MKKLFLILIYTASILIYTASVWLFIWLLLLSLAEMTKPSPTVVVESQKSNTVYTADSSEEVLRRLVEAQYSADNLRDALETIKAVKDESVKESLRLDLVEHITSARTSSEIPPAKREPTEAERQLADAKEQQRKVDLHMKSVEEQLEKMRPTSAAGLITAGAAPHCSPLLVATLVGERVLRENAIILARQQLEETKSELTRMLDNNQKAEKVEKDRWAAGQLQKDKDAVKDALTIVDMMTSPHHKAKALTMVGHVQQKYDPKAAAENWRQSAALVNNSPWVSATPEQKWYQSYFCMTAIVGAVMWFLASLFKPILETWGKAIDPWGKESVWPRFLSLLHKWPRRAAQGENKEDASNSQ